MDCKDCIHFDVCEEKWAQRFIFTQGDKAYMHGVDERCKHFKDKSRMVELPVKVGQTVYRIWACGKNGHSIANFKVIGIHNRGDGWYIIYEGKKKCYTAYFTDFGKSVFLTKSEAENALAKNHQK